MTTLLRNALALVLLFVSSSALASETFVQGRMALRACEYASSYEAEVGLSYRNYTLPWGTSVYLVYGWGGSAKDGSNPFDWANTQTLAVSASAPYTWSTTVRETTSTRSGSTLLTHIDFVWKVVLPNGYEFYEKGNGSTWGYYTANLSQIQESPCASSPNFPSTPTSLTVTSVEKW
ncbi:hypothetical protein [Pyxidicoccus trucidator]|uniref:hypothetical protein n=1 Tax=Pyxidicoccus trucidator TaxID=2709662 RepID=UPI0013D9169B|nr:hypothetical protein [Pyxidicoccus trucidator]